MNRFDLVDRIAARNNISKAEADRVVVSVFEEIMSAVTMGDSVTLIGFGSFRAVESAPRTGRNPPRAKPSAFRRFASRSSSPARTSGKSSTSTRASRTRNDGRALQAFRLS